MISLPNPARHLYNLEMFAQQFLPRESSVTRSRIESDREDLLAEAVNLPERVELIVPGLPEPVTVGCSAAGQWSFYFGAESMVRLDSAGRLKRAFHNGRLYRTQGTTLAELTRVRSETETELQRRDLSEDELRALLILFGTWLVQIRTSSRAGTSRPIRAVGTHPDFEERLLVVLAPVSPELTLAPAFATRRS